MCQLVAFLEPRCDVLSGLVVTGVVTGVVVAGVVVTGVVGADDELDAAPLDAAPRPVLADGDGEDAALVVLVVAAVVEVVLLTLAASNGSRVWLVGVVRCPEEGLEWWVAGDDVVEVPPAAGGAAMSALARWPCNTNGTATMATMITIASGQRRRSKRSRFRDFILWPP